jgi:hypothetical protein
VQAEIEEAEANVVRQIFQMYADGMGWHRSPSG